jgi:Zn finger protein HypA/HybF involved in hydrogenase expression
MSIAQSILNIIKQELDQNDLTWLIRVRVKFGRLTNIVPEALETGFMALTFGTPLRTPCSNWMRFPPVSSVFSVPGRMAVPG